MSLPIGQPIAFGTSFPDLNEDTFVAILRTITDGWEIARQNPKMHLEPKEVPITECLRDGMRIALKHLPWRKSLIVPPGTESRSTLETLIPDGRTDIPLYLIEIFLQYDEHDPHAIIECKRVAESNSHLTREYIVEGVDRFQSGKYGRNHSKGFMVGYILSGTPLGVVAGINKFLGKHGRNSEQLKSTSFVGCGLTWESQHQRGKYNKPIDLHHAMLETQNTKTSTY